ncbi:MAG: hydroxymyristoyl-ACP dehydratase [Bacteroidales bacterium]|jgi:predicted hotdog family 3-hydroxylacyl-ACP dehydratase|nr:hydroxymyristoyl-ACP dehydratase [Bacteroidales bacterium]
MNPTDYSITDLIPQRPPMVMIDTLVHAGEKSAGGRLYINAANIFCRDGKLQEAGMVEFVAQTAAAWTGYLQREAGKPVRLGYIGSIKNLVINSLPKADSEIVSEIVVDSELLGYTIITGKILQSVKVLMQCEMRIKVDSAQ